jgi:hypothetical protein
MIFESIMAGDAATATTMAAAHMTYVRAEGAGNTPPTSAITD